jgi:hypothetical protein
MSAIAGDDQGWQLSGYGVLGTGTPRAFVDRDNVSHDLDGYGVWGLFGTPQNNSDMIDEITSNWPISPLRAAVVGRNGKTDIGFALYGECRPALGSSMSSGFIAGRNPIGGEQTGVFGRGPRGVIGAGDGPDGAGVVGTSNGTGVVGYSGSASGIGVHGVNAAGGVAGQFDGDLKVSGKLVGDVNVERTLNVGGDLLLVNGDIAERFAVSAADTCTPGMVLTICDNGELAPCRASYDKRVIGVVSGAGTLKPAVTLRHDNRDGASAVVALVGTVYCMVDAQRVPIELGDLLVSSDTSGHAMKAGDPLRAFGAVIGKALGALETGFGIIPILVALQ